MLNTRTSTYQSQINFFVKSLQNQESPSKKCANAYTFGFNGKEKDDEIKGVGNQIDYGMRGYDPRIGRPISVDALFRQYPMLSSYQFFSNNPIWFIDLDGNEGIVYTANKFTNSDGETIIDVTTEYDANGKTEGVLWVMHDLDNRTVTTKYIPDVDIVSTRTFTNIIKDKQQELSSSISKLDNRYYGEEGFKQLGGDISDGAESLGKTSGQLKAGGVIAVGIGTVTAQPEIVAGGLKMYTTGSAIEKAANGIELVSNVMGGDGKKFATNAVKMAVETGIGKTIDKNVSDKSVKTFMDYLSGETIDAVTTPEK